MVRTVPKFNRKIVERGKIDILDCLISWLGTIKGGAIKLDSWAK